MIARSATAARTLAFLATMCSVAAVARLSGDVVLLVVGIAGLAGGNIYMSRTGYSASRLRTAVLFLMLVALLAYLGRDSLFSWTSDRLLLARVLVYGLIVTSFDLRTRRHVLGSLVVSGLLLVFLSEMSFGLWYPALVGAFVLLALGAATAGHGEEEASRAEVVGSGTWRTVASTWVLFAPVLALLTLAVFMLVPRVSLSSPVQASWLPSHIDLTREGPNQRPGRPSSDVSPGILGSLQLGGSRDRQYVALGYAGAEPSTTVMHVRSRVASYWRGSVLDQYDGRGWLPASVKLRLVDEGRGEFVFPDSNLGTSGHSLYSQSYYLDVDQPNAVFTGYNPGRVFLPQLSQGYLDRGTAYRAISPLPRLTPDLLRLDVADSTDSANLVLPPIIERTAALTESIVQGAPTDYDKAVRLEQYLLGSFNYDLGVEPLPQGRDAVDTFLFEQRAGYCAHFATAMAVMARHVGLPARVAIGYAPGVFDPMTGTYAVRAGDAHAWVEIKFHRSGWVAFDPTPRPDVTLGSERGWVSLGLMDFMGGGFGGTVSTLAGGWSLAWLPFQQLWIWLVALSVVVIGGALVLLAVSRRGGGRGVETFGYTTMEGELRQEVLVTYHRMLRLLARKGLMTKKATQTPWEYTRRVLLHIDGGQEAVEWLTQAATTAAYDPRPVSPTMATEAQERLADLRRTVTVS